MSTVLIRDVPDDDIDLIRSAAADRGLSLQRYLREAVQSHATYLRRQGALERTRQRLHGSRVVPDEERRAVLDDIDVDLRERAGEVDGRRPR
ncbi:MAG: hypothetical protein ACRCY8_10330 [Dermatophilaceae bacterium]